jgi:hypothetical protein
MSTSDHDTLAGAISGRNVDAPCVPMDDFGHRGAPATGWPRLLEQVRLPLHHGPLAEYHRRNWSEDRAADVHLPRALVHTPEADPGMSAARHNALAFGVVVTSVCIDLVCQLRRH